MILRWFVLSLFVLSNRAVEEEYDEHLPIEERIKYMKFQLEQQLKAKMDKQKRGQLNLNVDEEPSIVNANYDYVDLANVPITPINEGDDRKKDRKFKLRQLATTPKVTTRWTAKSSWPFVRKEEPYNYDMDGVDNVPKNLATLQYLFNPIRVDKINDFEAKNEEEKTNNKQESKPNRLQHKDSTRTSNNSVEPVDKPVQFFYRQRRFFQDVHRADIPLQWTHCEELITPYLTGLKGDLEKPKLIGSTHRTITRLVNLLKTDVSNSAKEDILSLLYQISNVQIRLFQWETDAIDYVLSTICKGKHHTFQNIKRGLKDLFASWHLDTSNYTNLLAQSKLFRPYCIDMKQDGSTKSSKILQFTRPTEKNEKCDSGDSDDDN